MKFLFDKPLVKGIIRSRPNRFIMFIEIDGVAEKAHCPCTGRIGDIKFKDIPCLVSYSDDPKRKTQYTVEAVSVNGGKSWIGINQTKANAYIAYFLKENALKKMTGKVEKLEREVVAGKSRIDFRVNGIDYIEVKTPLINLQLKYKAEYERIKSIPFTSFERLIKHFGEIASHVPEGSRAIVIMNYLYDAERFVPPMPDKKTVVIHRAVGKAVKKGLVNWQVNLKIDEKGVELLDYFPLSLAADLKTRVKK